MFGVGVNDSWFMLNYKRNGKTVKHRAYSAWYHILSRCYGDDRCGKNRAYSGCTVCDEWLKFSNFYEWWKNNHVDGWEIDKDMINTGNKEYHPDKCIFLPHGINVFCCNNHNGEFLPGVYFDKEKNKFKAQCKNSYLGYFVSEMDAHDAWMREKIRQAGEMKALADSIHPQLYNGIIDKINSIWVGLQKK